MGSAVSRCEADEEQPEEQQDDGPQMSGVHVASRGDEKLDYYSKDGNNSGDDAEGNSEGADDDSGEVEADVEDEEHRPEVQVATTPNDPRFPGFNQARACYTRYNEFYKCKAQKNESDPECSFYQRAYRSLCPGEWVESWNEQRENGNWFGKY